MIAPTSPLSWAMTVITYVCLIISLICLYPFIRRRDLRNDYPGGYLGYIVMSSFFFQIGLLIGSLYDYNPIVYATQPLCTVQGILFFVFGLWSLLMLAAYVHGIYRVVVKERYAKQKEGSWLQIGITWLMLALSVGCILPASYVFQDEYTYFDEELEDNVTVLLAFGPTGPWCGPYSTTGLFASFYVPAGLASLFNIYCAFRVLLKVHKTSKQSAKTARSRKKKNLRNFYIRLCGFSVMYGATTISAAITRYLRIGEKGESSTEIGIFVVYPILLFVELVIIASTPSVVRYYKIKVYKTTGYKLGGGSTLYEDYDERKGSSMTSRRPTDMMSSRFKVGSFTRSVPSDSMDSGYAITPPTTPNLIPKKSITEVKINDLTL